MTSKDGNLYNGTKESGQNDAVKDNETSIQDIKVALEAAVHRQLMRRSLWSIAWRIRFSITWL
jgi:asparagine synthase (glutamine-hydrolysing)